MKKIIRKYKDSDYAQCEELVNQAWGFDDILFPQALADFAKCMYTKGSVLTSNWQMVVEVEGEVAGFLFGFNEFSKKTSRNIVFRLKMLWWLIRIKCDNPDVKHEFINALKMHEQNRAKIVDKGVSEIVLFVVGKEHRGKSYGKELWQAFLDQCKSSGVASIVVETNMLGASGYYEHLGFRHLGDFASPLHEYATKGGQACMYEYICDR